MVAPCFPGVPAPPGWTHGLLAGLGGVCPRLREHLRGVLAGSVPHGDWGTREGMGPYGHQAPYESTLPTPGNEVLHSLTKAGDYSMRVDLRAGDEAVFAQYDSFRVDSAADYYRLHLAGYHGTAGESGAWGLGGMGQTALTNSRSHQGTP